MNKKENWLRTVKGDHPEWIPLPWEAFQGSFPGVFFTFDPITSAFRPSDAPLDTPFLDSWGSTWMMQTGSPAPAPVHTAENAVIKDITTWRESLKFPDLDGHDWGWAKSCAAKVNRNEMMVMPMIPAGIFELSHLLMGFEDALCNFMIEPEATDELIGALTDWKIGHLERVMENIHPDVIHYHDDWGSKAQLFLPPDTWRAMIKPHHKRIVDCVKSYGAMFMHHSDSICEPIVEDMAEIGIDIWQGAIPQNDIVAIQKKLNGRMAIMGGIDAQLIDMPKADEAVIRQEVRRCIDTYCPQGYFLPCIPNIEPINPEVKRIYEDEIINYGKIWMASH